MRCLLILLLLTVSVLAAPYTDAQQRFTLDAPDGWQALPGEGGGDAFVIFRGPTLVEGVYPTLTVMRLTLSAPEPALDEAGARNMVTRAGKHFLSWVPVHVGGFSGGRWLESNNTGKTRMTRMVTALQRGVLEVNITAAAPTAEFSRYADTFRQVSDSFRVP